MSYEYWEKALADPAALRMREFRITSDPQPGYYRTWRLNEPVAIWNDPKDGLVVSVNGSEVFEDDYETVWLNCAKNPVSEADYHLVVGGGTWPDLDEAVAAVGDNRRKGDDPEALIDDLAAQAETYKVIDDDALAKRAISLRAALLEQHKLVDRKREEAKAPYLKSAREVDEIWMPTVKKAKKWADYLRIMVESWETRKRQAARIAAEKMAEAARAANIEIPMILEDGPPPQDQIRTGYGRAASVRTRMVVTDFRSLEDLFRHYRNDDRLHQALLVMAQADVDNGLTVPGVTVEERAVVR